MKWLISAFLLLLSAATLSSHCNAQKYSSCDLHFTRLPERWDEAIPLGNGMLGMLVWQKDSALRLSLDRADLWDLRPVAEFASPQFSYQWVYEQVKSGTYDTVQQLFDVPYERDPAPTKIPAGALELSLQDVGAVKTVHLFLNNAVCEIEWETGASMMLFVDANQTLGWFRIKNWTGVPQFRFIPPDYAGEEKGAVNQNSVNGQGLRRLNYAQGSLESGSDFISFKQRGWRDFEYEVSVSWRQTDAQTIEGSWSITTKNSPYSSGNSAQELTQDAAKFSFDTAFRKHTIWWKRFGDQSAIHIPDTLLENQWYREMYKFGSASRKGSPPITLQAVWTADNGNLPPWKGDLHHDLNTEMSYWPGYAANHLEESSVFTDWLWKFQDTAAKFSASYFKCEGNNFPGVSTLTGQPMGGWIQYAFSPTTSCWLSHHFYLQWKYSMDQDFLTQRAYPFLKQTGLFIDRISVKEGRFKRLPISSSPEFDDNSIKAWHSQTTNYDLSLIRNLYESLTEMAMAAGNEKEAGYWQKLLSGWPELSLSASKSLMVAPGYPYAISHRHFSHLMAIYPLGLIDRLHGSNEERIIEASLSELEKNGTGQWCGYSYAWLGNLMARSGDGEKAAAALRSFASCFCSPNSFHLNGDQSGTGKSSYTYRPFTLEGNFAFASGVEEMLLQSHDGVIRIFPAIPASWDTVSFTNLRAQGAFLVSATRSGGKTLVVTIKSEKGGTLVVENPFTEKRISVTGTNRVKFLKSGFLEIETHQDDYITFSF